MAIPEYQPAWLTFEIEQALQPLSRKRRTTILRLAEATATGKSWAETFKQPEVCSRTCWYGHYRNGVKKSGWCEEDGVQRALLLATARAQAHEDGRIARLIQKAQGKLAEAAPAAVGVLITLMGAADNEEVRRKAANDILDRASLETASKGADEVKIKMTWGENEDLAPATP